MSKQEQLYIQIARYTFECEGWGELLSQTKDEHIQEIIISHVKELYETRLSLAKRLKGITEVGDFCYLKDFLRNCHINPALV